MEFKTKSHIYKLVSADISDDKITVTFYQNGETQDEMISVFRSPDETGTMEIGEKEATGFTEMCSMQFQNGNGDPDAKPTDLLAIVTMKKPDLTADKLAAAITYLGLMSGNSEVTEVLK